MFKQALMIALVSGVGVYAGINHIESLNSRVNDLEESVFKKCPPVERNEWSVGGELLYWQTNMTGDVYVLSHGTLPATQFGAGSSIDTNVTARTVSFDYDPGFRLWSAYQLPFDEWGLDLIWTSFQSSASNSVDKTAVTDLHCVWDTTSVMVATHASGKMHEDLQVIDLSFGKMFLWSKPFSFRLYTGLKGAFVDEKFRVVYQGTFTGVTRPATEVIVIKNDMKGIGLNSGLKACWSLWRGLSFYGRGEVAVLWGKFKTKFSQTLDVGGDINASFPIASSSPFRSLKANLVAEAGFNWNVDLGCSAKLSLFGGYEFNYWPNQIIWNRFLINQSDLTGGIAYILQQLGDVGFQGVNLGGSLSF
jgi:hypothetical protein